MAKQKVFTIVFLSFLFLAYLFPFIKMIVAFRDRMPKDIEEAYYGEGALLIDKEEKTEETTQNQK